MAVEGGPRREWAADAMEIDELMNTLGGIRIIFVRDAA